jgi:hypothetical protein
MPLDDRLRTMYDRVAADAGDDVATATLDAVVSRTRRRRVRRRIEVAAVCAAAIIAAALVALPQLSRDDVPVDGRRHEPSTRSQVHHYAADAPPGWTVHLGRTPWRVGTDRGAPGVQDVFQSPGKPAIQVASQVIPPGMTRAQWYAEYLGPDADKQMPQCFGPPSSWAKASVDGVTGGLFGGLQWCSFTQVIVIKGTRAYVINAVNDATSITQEPFKESVLDAFLASVRLDP